MSDIKHGDRIAFTTQHGDDAGRVVDFYQGMPVVDGPQERIVMHGEVIGHQSAWLPEYTVAPRGAMLLARAAAALGVEHSGPFEAVGAYTSLRAVSRNHRPDHDNFVYALTPRGADYILHRAHK